MDLRQTCQMERPQHEDVLPLCRLVTTLQGFLMVPTSLGVTGTLEKCDHGSAPSLGGSTYVGQIAQQDSPEAARTAWSNLANPSKWGTPSLCGQLVPALGSGGSCSRPGAAQQLLGEQLSTAWPQALALGEHWWLPGSCHEPSLWTINHYILGTPLRSSPTFSPTSP